MLPHGVDLEIIEFIPEKSIDLIQAGIVDPGRIKSLTISWPDPLIATLRNLECIIIGHPDESEALPIDILFLSGMKLRHIAIHGYCPTNIEPLRGMPLEFVELKAFIGDDSPLRGCPINTISIGTLCCQKKMVC